MPLCAATRECSRDQYLDSVDHFNGESRTQVRSDVTTDFSLISKLVEQRAAHLYDIFISKRNVND